MKINRLAIEALVVGVLLLATVLHAVAAMPPAAGGGAPDSTTADRLSRASLAASPVVIQAAAVDTRTLAAMLASDLLLAPIDFTVDLPIVLKSPP